MDIPTEFRRRLLASLILAWLGLGLGIAQERVIISEFMAANVRTLVDRDRDYSDWIELYNAGASAANLDGWFLTDSRKNLKKWKFPAVTLGPGEFLVVFASKKDRRVPGAELHTNFKLDAERGYLALVKPDGSTVASDFAPEYPRQVAGASFGLEMADRPAPVFSSATPKKVFVPAADIGMGWTAAEFDDSKWSTMSGSVAFGNSAGGFDLQAAMANKASSAYVRIPFELKDGDVESLRLKVRANDGFVAYLNGREVARTNAPGKPQWNSVAPGARDASAPLLLSESFDASSKEYVLAQTDPASRPRLFWHDTNNVNAFLRLLDGRQPDQVHSVAFPQAAPGVFDSIVADFDFRWGAAGEGTERFALMLIPVAQYRANGAGADLSAMRDQKDPKFPGTLAVQLLHSPQNGGKALTIYWDRMKRHTRDLPEGLLGQRVFHHAQVRVKHTEQGALVSVDLISDPRGPGRQTFNAAADVLIPGVQPYQPRVQLTARAGDRDQTVDVDNLRVEFHRAGAGTVDEFDLSGNISALRAGKNVLALHALNQSAADATFQIEPELIAGYSPMRSKEPRYFATPTPRAVNHDGLRKLSPPPVFSKRGGVFTAPVKIEFTSASGVVRYTLDGSEPNLNSAIYSEPVTLTGWTVVEVMMLGWISFLQPLMLGVGIALLVLGWLYKTRFDGARRHLAMAT